MPNKPRYELRKDNQVLVVYVYGAWNEGIAKRFIRAFKALAKTVWDKPWAHIVYLEEWALSTPAVEPMVKEMLEWCVDNGMSHTVRVYAPDPLKDFQINKMFEEGYKNHIVAHFENVDDAFEYLAQQGLPVSESKIVA